MNNPILSKLSQSNTSQFNNIGQIKNIFNMIKNSGNPVAMFNGLMQNNPKMKEVNDFIQQNGGDPKKAFYAKANELGINPDEILSMLK